MIWPILFSAAGRQAARICHSVVRVGVHDLVGVFGDSAGLGRRPAGAGGERRNKNECPHLHQISVPRKRYRWLAW